MSYLSPEYKELIKTDDSGAALNQAISGNADVINNTNHKLLYENILPDTIKAYPVVPFHYKWTGTPFPVSAVSPLIGKQREINKSHQLMVHNASLGSSLRWMYDEGSVDTD